MRRTSLLVTLVLVTLLPCAAVHAVDVVIAHQKISDTAGGFTGELGNVDHFGFSVAGLGDLDGDELGDVAVGAWGDDDGGIDRGAVWILFLDGDGTVKTHQKISDTEGGFTGVLAFGDRFGNSMAALGDMDGDGVGDLAVGANGDDNDRGAIWILFLNDDGTVKSHQKISATEGGFTGRLDEADNFGFSVAALGDLDGDGVRDVAVGAFGDDDGRSHAGAVWILFLNGDGTVKGHQKISATEGGLDAEIDLYFFGASMAALGDHDGDGVDDLAVGAPPTDLGGNSRGALWILMLNPDGTVKTHELIGSTMGGFTGQLDDDDWFGISVASLGDHDGDGIGDIAVGAMHDDDGGFNLGAVWLLFLNHDGTVRFHRKISTTVGGFTGQINAVQFGRSLTSLGDHDGNGAPDLAVGNSLNDGGGHARGRAWILFLDQTACPDANDDVQVDAGDLVVVIRNWGCTQELEPCAGDVNGDGTVDVLDLVKIIVEWGPCP